MQRVLSLFNLEHSALSDYGVDQVRAVIFRFLSIGGVILGAVTLTPAALLAFAAGNWAMGFIFLALYGWILFFTFWKGMSLKIRIGCGLFFVYLTGTATLLTRLPLDISLTYLFAFAVLTGLLLDERASLLAVLINAVTVMVLYRLSGVQPGIAGDLYSQVYLALSLGLGFGMMLLVAAAVSMLVRRLQESLDHQQQLTRQLQREIAERRSAENALQTANNALSRLNHQLATILDIGSRLQWDRNPELLLHEIAQHYRELGFCAVALNVRDPKSDTMHIYVSFGDESTDGLPATGTVYTWGQFNRCLREEFRRGECYFIPEGEYAWDEELDGPTFMPPVSQVTDDVPEHERWKPGDVLLVPLRRINGELFGALSFDQPFDGRRPQPEQLRLLELFSREASAAFSNAEMYAQLRERLELQEAAEAELRTLNQELKRAVRHKDEFLASMSHELRTPLTAILGIAEALTEGVYGSLNESQRRGFERIVISGRELMAMISNLLDVARYDAGKMTFSLGELSTHDLCQSCLRAVESDATAKDIGLQCELDDPTLVLQVDPKRAKQLLTHLLANAVKFTPDGGRVGVQTVAHKQDETVDFIVWDTGIGIEPEKLTQIFEPFVQSDGSLTRRYSGAGLGLALVSRLVRLHNGSVALQSELGKGTRVTVTLPVHQSETRDVPPGKTLA